MITTAIRDKYFTAHFVGKIHHATELAEGCVALMTDTLMVAQPTARDVRVVLIPCGECYGGFGSAGVIELHFNVLNRHRPHKRSRAQRLYDALTQGRMPDYLSLVGDARSTFGKEANRIIEAIRVPGGIVAMLASESLASVRLVHAPNGRGHLPASSNMQTLAETEVPDLPGHYNRLSYQDSHFYAELFKEVIRRQITHKNVSMHVPSYRFRTDTMQYAIAMGWTDNVKELATKTLNICYGDWEKDTPLHHAAMLGKNMAITSVLLEAGAKLHRKNRLGDTPLDVAIACDNAAAAAALLEAQCMESIDCHGLSVLEACEEAKSPQVEAVCRSLLAAREARRAVRSLGAVLSRANNAP